MHYQPIFSCALKNQCAFGGSKLLSDRHLLLKNKKASTKNVSGRGYQPHGNWSASEPHRSEFNCMHKQSQGQVKGKDCPLNETTS
jgi:hypothetical protein